jgi:hypothetical protein
MPRRDIAKLAPVRPGAGGVRSRFLFIFLSLFAPSTQGERARLLTGNEAGSIPAGRANTIPARSGNGADSKPAQERSIRLRRCQFARWQSGQCRGLQNRCRAVRFRLARPSDGDMREQANPPRRERGPDRIDTDMSPQLRRCPLKPALLDAASFNGRTTRSERDDRGSIPWAAAKATAGCSRSARVFEAREVGAIPAPAARLDETTPVRFLVRSPAPQAGETGFDSRTGDQSIALLPRRAGRGE